MSENDMCRDGMEREDCWFFGCSNPLEGYLHSEDGDVIEVCGHHGDYVPELGAWKRYVEADT